MQRTEDDWLIAALFNAEVKNHKARSKPKSVEASPPSSHYWDPAKDDESGPSRGRNQGTNHKLSPDNCWSTRLSTLKILYIS